MGSARIEVDVDGSVSAYCGGPSRTDERAMQPSTVSVARAMPANEGTRKRLSFDILALPLKQSLGETRRTPKLMNLSFSLLGGGSADLFTSLH